MTRTRPLTGSLPKSKLASTPAVDRQGERDFVIALLAAERHPTNARRYDDLASGATYVESDPIGLGGGVNTHAYALGNPVSNADPLGLELGAALTALMRAEGFKSPGPTPRPCVTPPQTGNWLYAIPGALASFVDALHAQVYNHDQAEKAWGRMTALFSSALA